MPAKPTDKTVTERIAYNLRRLRGKLTQRDLAALCGGQQSMIAEIEHGRIPLATTLYRIAVALQVDPSEFYKPIPRSKPAPDLSQFEKRANGC